MSTMPINQLPTPIQVPSINTATVSSVPTPPAPPVVAFAAAPSAWPTTLPQGASPMSPSAGASRIKMMAAGLAAAVVLMASVGGVLAVARGGDGSGGANGGGNGGGGTAGNASISMQQLAGAYSSEFGVSASNDTLRCVADELPDDVAPSVEALLNGRLLDFDDTRAALLPFTTCAPDEDFLPNMVTAGLMLAPDADEDCVSDLMADSNPE